MICRAFEGMSLAGQRLECLGGPALIWAGIAAGLITLVSLGLALRTRPRAASRLVTAGLFSLSALLLVTAIERPVLRQSLDAGTGGHITLLLDASESFWREPSRARAALDLAALRIETFLAGLAPDEAALWRGEMISFGAAAVQIAGGQLGGGLPASGLAAALRRWPPPPEPRSDLNAGLMAAQAAVQAQTGRRMLILVSDAIAAAPVDPALLAGLRAEAVPVHLILAGATAPSAGLIAADLGPEHRLNDPALVRATVLGAGTLRATQGGTGSGAGDRTGDSSADEPGEGAAVSVVVPDAPGLRAVRLTTRFARRGLQGLSLSYSSAAGTQSRSLFTLVRGPARVLVFGAAPWAGALPPGRWRIERADPARPPAPAGYDLVVIDALVPSEFPPGYDRDLLAAADGTGLLLINGALRGTSAEPQRISDWSSSALGPILPVDSDPRLLIDEPPPRDIVIMVDVSGSMAGRRLGSAQSAIGAILRQLRPRDTVAILPFSDSPLRRFERAQASPATLEAARRFAMGLRASGGTAPDSTIRESSRFVSNYCAFFFISDADFAPPHVAPQCFTTAISVSNARFGMNIAAWGEEILVGEGGNADNISLRYFEPDERTEFYREGSFVPLAARGAGPGPAPLTGGLAIAYPRLDGTAELLHPAPPPDPLYVWRRDSARSGIAAGVFLGPMGADWGGAGLARVEAMLGQLLAWADQDRYLVRLLESPEGYRLLVTPTGAGADAAVPGDAAPGDAATGGVALSAAIAWADGTTTGVPMRFDARRGSHEGSFTTPPNPGAALLILTSGSDVQRIPVGFPPQYPRAGNGTGTGGESLEFGIDAGAAALILAGTGGQLLDRMELPSYTPPSLEKDLPLHAFPLALACLLLGAAVWSRELRQR